MTQAQERRRRVKRILLRRDGYQFTQPTGTASAATRVVPGDVACADTSIQLVLRILRGKWHSVNFIRKKSGNAPDVPMLVVNAERALRAFGLDYRIRSDLTTRELMVIARTRGPVLIAEDYWAHPQWKGYDYFGIRMTGTAMNSRGRRTRVGFADPEGRAGRNQPTFTGGHMVLLASSIPVKRGRSKRYNSNDGFIRDPNHGTAARPERPAWDRVTQRQLGRMLRSFNSGRNIVAIVPMRSLWED